MRAHLHASFGHLLALPYSRGHRPTDSPAGQGAGHLLALPVHPRVEAAAAARRRSPLLTLHRPG
eukprot:scaffold91710_cov45-Phaeocystis_antarctica.AAC.1